MLIRIYKQVVIAVIFLIIVFLIGYGIYQLAKPKLTCFDGIQNCHHGSCEMGIDCEGPCSDVMCMPSLEKISVFWASVIPAIDNYYDAGARLRNPNQNYGVGKIPYQFKFYNSAGAEIAQRSGITYILPNQTKYLVETRIYSDQKITSAELIVSEDIEWQKFKEYQSPELVIKDKIYSSLYTQASGVVLNNSNYDFNDIIVDVLLFDKNDQVVGLRTTVINTLKAGDDRKFLVVWQEEFDKEIGDKIMEAETNVFDSSNFMKRFGVPEAFQRY